MKLDPFLRFERYFVVQPSGCWEWIGVQTGPGYKEGKGYGSFKFNRKMVGAHVWAYENLVGPVPDGLELDHLCRFTPCINPEHLEPVTRSVNVRRGNEARGPKVQCKRGHLFTAENTYIDPRGDRNCIICKNERLGRWRVETGRYKGNWGKYKQFKGGELYGTIRD